MNAPTFGHNESIVRLGILAHDAQLALERVAKGEADAIDGWIAYGAALNEGRALHPGDREFGRWLADIVHPQVGGAPHDDERAAAMWAAGFPDQFAQARTAGNARTVRGIHAKWKEIEAEAEAEAKRIAAEEARKKAEAKRKEAEAKAAAEAEARRVAQEAEDEAAREAAEALAEEAAAEAAEAEEAAARAEREAEEAEKEAVEGTKKVRGTQGTGDNEWYTPPEHIERARRVMGDFDVDPASNPVAQEKIGAGEFFTEETNGLEREWNGRIWLNPPYAQPLIGQFMSKLREEYEAGRCTEAVALTHNYTDTRWFQDTARAATAICFTRGRIKFYSPSGDIAAPTQGQAFFYFGPNVDAFSSEFSEVGFVVEVRHE